MDFGQQIEWMVGRGRRRLFLKRFVRFSAIALACSVAIAAVLVALARAGVAFCGGLWALCVLPWIVCALVAWPWRTSKTEIARQIDAANGFGERLSSSIAFMRGEQTEWMKIQIADTAKRLADPATRESFGKKAFALQKPAYLKALAWTIVGSVVVAFLPDVVSLVRGYLTPAEIVTVAGDDDNAPDAAPVVHRSNLDVVSADLRQEQAEELLKAAQELDDPEIQAAAEELAQILEDDKAGKLSAEEFARRMAALEKKLDAMTAPTAQEQKAFDEAIRDAVQSFSQMKEDPETQKLAEALEKNDYDMAADILRDLVNSTDPKDKKKLEKLAKMFGDLAKKVDPTDPELKEALQKHKDLVDQLEKEFKKNGKLSDEDKKAFEEAAKKMKDGEQQQQQQRNADQTSKALNKLQKAMNNTAEDLENKANKPTDETQQGDNQNPDGEQTGEPQKSGDKKDGQQQGSEQKQGQQGSEQQQGQQGSEQKQGQQGSEQQQGQQGSDQQQGQQGSEQQGAEGKDGADNQSAEDALRDAAKQKKAQEQRDKLKDLADKMKKDAQNGQEKDQDQAGSEQRDQNMQDFLERAKGQKKEDQDKQEGQQGQQSGQEQQGDDGQQGQQGDQDAEQGQQGQQGSQQGQENQGSQGPQQAQEANQGDSGAQEGMQQGQESGSSTELGTSGGHDETEGDATSLNANLKDERLQGMDSGQKTTAEVIESAAQSGFATESYKEVYQTYEKAAEDILESESVPQGYRNYVEKYFDMIRPQK